jgi:hypothetical protein
MLRVKAALAAAKRLTVALLLGFTWSCAAVLAIGDIPLPLEDVVPAVHPEQLVELRVAKARSAINVTLTLDGNHSCRRRTISGS